LLASAHDCSIGGIAIALAESCIGGSFGAEIELKTDIRSDCSLFGESQSRIIVTVKPSNYNQFTKMIRRDKVPFQQIGIVKGDHLKINHWVNLSINQMEKAWRMM